MKFDKYSTNKAKAARDSYCRLQEAAFIYVVYYIQYGKQECSSYGSQVLHESGSSSTIMACSYTSRYNSTLLHLCVITF